jgi:hypothetical protein
MMHWIYLYCFWHAGAIQLLGTVSMNSSHNSYIWGESVGPKPLLCPDGTAMGIFWEVPGIS